MEDATEGWQPTATAAPGAERALALVVLAFPADPARVGEVAFVLPGETRVLGRHGTLDWVRHRPDGTRPRGPLVDPKLSRQQLEVAEDGGILALRNLGRLPLRLDGVPVEEATWAPGSVLRVADRVLLGLVERARSLPGAVDARHRFGEADARGLLGESEAAWALRERVAFLARRDRHVLVLGPSGTGKELVARALHALSPRANGPWIARNAATIPESLADAELFGNAAGYPNPGTGARPGLVGEADKGTLFLDELGELPPEQQARLLRVMDDGEYTRLGEARPRTSDLRVVAATNRAPEALKHDVLARFPLRVEVPPLGARREDIPLLASHIVRQIAREDAEIGERFLDGEHPRLALELVEHLVGFPWSTHVRELAGALWRSIGESPGDTLQLPAASDPAPGGPGGPGSGSVDPEALDAATIQATLDRHGGRQEPAWRELGLGSRHVLARLVKRHGLQVKGRGT